MTYSTAISTMRRAALCALLGLCLTVGLLARAGAVSASVTFPVTHTADDLLPGSLRSEITLAEASPSSVVVFQIPTSDPGVSSATNTATITLALGPVVVSTSGSVSIAGGNSPSGAVVVDGAGQSRVFTVTAGTVAISGLTIQNGRATGGPAFPEPEGGGGILNTANLTLTNCAVTANGTSGSGGGISNSGTLTLTGSVINANQAGSGGGAIYSTNGSVSLTRCTLNGNSAPSGNGGGISSNSDTQLTVVSCTITGNQSGGGPSRNGGGGGIYAYFDTMTQITNTTVSGNTSVGGRIGGGGIALGYGPASMTNCFVEDNTILRNPSAATFTSGGGIEVTSNSGVATTASLTLTNCVIAGNQSDNYGGGIANEDSTTTAINCTFTGNTTPGATGGGITAFGGSITLINDILYNDVGQSEIGRLAGAFGTNGQLATINATYSDIEQATGVYPGTGNINADPQFVRNADPTVTPPDPGDEHLRFTSPAVHTGTNGPGVPITDIEGTPRPVPPARPSIGAYEVPGSTGFSAQGGFTVTGTQNVSTGTQVVAKFLPGATAAAGFTATIDFGDGSALTAGTISADPTASGVSQVTGSHTYASYGSFTVTTVITGPGGTPAATVTSTATIQPAQVAADVTSQVSIFEGGLVFSRATKRYSQTVTITNNSAVTIVGPISLALDNLSPGVTVFSPSGTTQYAPPAGSPYQNAASTGLAPGATVSLVLQLTYAGSARIGYTPRVLAGPGAR